MYYVNMDKLNLVYFIKIGNVEFKIDENINKSLISLEFLENLPSKINKKTYFDCYMDYEIHMIDTKDNFVILKESDEKFKIFSIDHLNRLDYFESLFISENNMKALQYNPFELFKKIRDEINSFTSNAITVSINITDVSIVYDIDSALNSIAQLINGYYNYDGKLDNDIINIKINCSKNNKDIEKDIILVVGVKL